MRPLGVRPPDTHLCPMTVQTSLFPDSVTAVRTLLPDGFRYRPDLIDAEEERALVAGVATLPFKPFEFQGYLAHRRVASFGFSYDYGRRTLAAAPELPPFLLGLRRKVAAFAGRAPESFCQVLVTEYGPGVGIGWHRDRKHYGEVVGVSLLSPAVLRFRRRAGDRWRRLAHVVQPRSAYHLAGEARHAWEHGIREHESLRYALTFRTLAEDGMPL
jgi:alkylated DNA repair dioxygenase AlkB